MKKPLKLLLNLEPHLDLAFVELGMSEEEFLLQTPRQWWRRVKALERKFLREDWRVAKLCAVLARCHGVASAQPVDFMPESVRPKQTEEEMLGVMNGLKAYQDRVYGK